MAVLPTRLAIENWMSKYQYDGESDLGTFVRVAKAIAEVDRTYGATEEEVEELSENYLRALVHFDPDAVDDQYRGRPEQVYVDKFGAPVGLYATPGGRITANLGTDYEKATAWNCFINSPVTGATITYQKRVPNSDQLIDCEISSEQTPDNLTNIFLSLLEAAETLKSEGGYGINFGFIRPRGTLIKGVGIRHPGVVSYMELWDKMSSMIVKGDNDGYHDTLVNHLDTETVDKLEKVQPRKGAMMAVLPIWHPDVEEFIRAKQESGRLTKFNISVLIDDAFMQAVQDDTFYDLHFNGEVYKKVLARDLYDLIMTSTYNRNEPGCLFFDNMNRNNPLIYLGPVTASNPCVTGDTWVSTEEGPRQVRDLVGKPFKALVEGQAYPTVSEGFWSTGVKPVYTLTTSRGYQIKLTADHPLRKVSSELSYEEEWTELRDLGVGDSIRLVNHRASGEAPSWGGAGTFNEGWLLGSLVGDGTIKVRDSGMVQACLDFWGSSSSFMAKSAQSKMEQSNLSVDYQSGDDRIRIASKDLMALAANYGLSHGAKGQVTSQMHSASSAFQRGFLCGLFDADGGVQQGNGSGISVKLSQSDADFLREVQRMLSRFGIAATLYEDRRPAGMRELPDGKGGTQMYDCRADHELIISKDNVVTYMLQVAFEEPDKSTKLLEGIAAYTKGPYSDSFVDTITSIELGDPEPVFDVTIEGVHEFDANGIRVSNCGEIPGTSFMDQHYKPADYLIPYMANQDQHMIGFTTVCLLASLNLPQFVSAEREFDFEKYAEVVAHVARMLENVNDTGVVPLPAYEWAVQNIRQYGMGINGLGSVLYMMGIRYGSPEALAFVEKIHQIKDDVSLRVSALLAKDRGPFPMYDERYLDTPYFRDICTASEETKALVRKYGVRNAKRLTNPPLGNSSVICGSVSNGIEPVFSWFYDRVIIADEWPEGLTRENVKDLFEEVQMGDSTVWRGEFAGRRWHYEPHNRGLCFIDEVRDYGYDWVTKNFPEDLENEEAYLVTAQELRVIEHVNMQAKVQESCDQSVSKTCNIPNAYPFDDFKDLYFEAWKAGLVGFTTYRDGTMEAVLETAGPKVGNMGSLLESLIEQGCTPEDAEVTAEGVVVRDVRLPDQFINGPTTTLRREGSKYYLHLSYLPNDPVNPVALWIHSNSQQEGEFVTLNRAFKAIVALLRRSGVDGDLVDSQVDKIHTEAHHVRLGKIISMALRHNVSVPRIVAAVSDIEGDYIATTLTAVRKYLMDQIQDGAKAIGMSCPSCSSTDIVFESGCSTCRSCGHSGCG